MGSVSSKATAVETTQSACPVVHEKNVSVSSETQTACPVAHKDALPYNVYSQPMDPTNQMPSQANQRPSPLQQEALSTERVSSTIPKGNTQDETWTYPSPQMFYNALARKGKLDGTTTDDMASVVAVHNSMNEQTWLQVLEWERVVHGASPKLLKFRGRPHDLSCKAWWKHWVWKHPLPFDRHDWTIQRANGTTVTYIIDYYHDDQGDDPLLVDVRPAVEGPTSFVARFVQMPWAILSHQTHYQHLPLRPSFQLRSQHDESVQVWQSIGKQQQQPVISNREATALAQSLSTIGRDCQGAQKKVQACRNDQECARASLDLNMCMGKIYCPAAHQQLVQALQQNNQEEEVATRLEALAHCVGAADQRTQQAKQEHPTLF